MTGIPAETAARRWGEEELRAVNDEGELPRDFWERIRALVFVGLLDRAVAERIMASYGRARALRGLGGYAGEDPGQNASVHDRLRVARCSGEVEVSGATIIPRWIMLGEHRARLVVTIRPGAGARPRRGPRHFAPLFLDIQEITVGDDTGRSVTAHLSGGGGGNEWRGSYDLEAGLSPDTAWIEVEGHRLAVDDPDSGATVRSETFDAADSSTAERANQYLEHCVAANLHGWGWASLIVVADTLVTCGALAADSPQVSAILGADEDGGPLPGAPYPASYGHPARRGRRGRRSATATVLVGVTTPPIDGVSVTVAEMESSADGFRVEVDGVGRVELGHETPPTLDVPRLAIRATDDRGNEYRGSLDSLHSGSAEFFGTVRFMPAPAPDAAAIDLEFRTERARAVVSVPLRRDERP